MCVNTRILLTICLLAIVVEAHVRREASTSPAPPLFDINKYKERMDEFKNCIDQHLANVAEDVQVKQVQPVFAVIGDQVDRFSKAWEALTGQKSTPSPDE